MQVWTINKLSKINNFFWISVNSLEAREHIFIYFVFRVEGTLMNFANHLPRRWIAHHNGVYAHAHPPTYISCYRHTQTHTSTGKLKVNQVQISIEDVVFINVMGKKMLDFLSSPKLWMLENMDTIRLDSKVLSMSKKKYVIIRSITPNILPTFR